MIRPEGKDECGLWDALYGAELGASAVLAEQLEPFRGAVTACFECGVAVPTLACGAPVTHEALLAGLFLKRCLGDLRGIWLLLNMGYTSQAASIAASAFENALTFAAILARPQDALQRVLSDTGETPWPPLQLCKIQAEIEFTPDTDEYEKRWREIYAAYKWRCRIKHPTAMSAIHDAGGSSTGRSGEYVVMAAPDVRKEDLPNKASIIAIAANRIHAAVAAFAETRRLDESDARVARWKEVMASIVPELSSAYRAATDAVNGSITIRGSTWSRNTENSIASRERQVGGSSRYSLIALDDLQQVAWKRERSGGCNSSRISVTTEVSSCGNTALRLSGSKGCPIAAWDFTPLSGSPLWPTLTLLAIMVCFL